VVVEALGWLKYKNDDKCMLSMIFSPWYRQCGEFQVRDAQVGVEFL
jgi:hypothetical protein